MQKYLESNEIKLLNDLLIALATLFCLQTLKSFVVNVCNLSAGQLLTVTRDFIGTIE